MKTTIKNVKHDQTGMVAITVSVILMMLILLIVTSFALIVRREQRQSLDRQLSTQALYAVESGINIITNGLNEKDSTGVPIINTSIDRCDGLESLRIDYDKQIGENSEVTCALVDLNPTTTFLPILNPSDGSTTIPIKASQPITSILVGWQDASGGRSFVNPSRSGLKALPQQSTDTLETGMVRVTVIPGFNSGSLTRNDYIQGSQTFFLYPNESLVPRIGESINYTVSTDQTRVEQGRILNGDCNVSNQDRDFAGIRTVNFCNIQINMPGTSTEYYINIEALYKPISTNLIALNSTTRLPQSDNQAVVDVTAKAGDVLRRVQARVAIGEGRLLREGTARSFTPRSVISVTDGICKRLEIGSTNYRDLCAPSGNTLLPL